jgi:hypothetical protein
VGDCALAILEAIAGRSFWQGTYTNAAMVKDGQAPETRQRVLAWWQQRQQEGEAAQLTRAVALGDRDCVSQAAWLVERYPEIALGAIQQGAANAVDVRIHSALICLAGRLEDRSIGWLREQVLRARRLSSRVAAARTLWARGKTDVLTLMIHEWHQLPFHPEQLIAPAHMDDSAISEWNQECNGPSDLSNFLILSGQPEAIRALSSELPRFPVDHRLQVIEALDEGRYLWFSWGEVLWERAPESPEVALAINELLVQRLDDIEERKGMSGCWGGKSIRDPRLCDLAGHILSRRWHQPSAFDLEAPQEVRDRQRAELQSMWRK